MGGDFFPQHVITYPEKQDISCNQDMDQDSFHQNSNVPECDCGCCGGGDGGALGACYVSIMLPGWSLFGRSLFSRSLAVIAGQRREDAARKMVWATLSVSRVASLLGPEGSCVEVIIGGLGGGSDADDSQYICREWEGYGIVKCVCRIEMGKLVDAGFGVWQRELRGRTNGWE